jgi:hypothetical protein
VDVEQLPDRVPSIETISQEAWRSLPNPVSLVRKQRCDLVALYSPFDCFELWVAGDYLIKVTMVLQLSGHVESRKAAFDGDSYLHAALTLSTTADTGRCNR